MKYLKKSLFLLMMLILSSGCGVSQLKPQNWTMNDPNDLSKELYRSNNLDHCRQQAQLPVTENTQDSASKYANYDKARLKSCMESRGYKLRELTDTEEFFNAISAPVVLPMTVLGKDFDNTY